MKQDQTKWYRIDYTKFPDAWAEACDSPKRKDTALQNVNNQYLRPSTLFNATNFENHMNELAALQKVKKIVPQSTVIDLTYGED